MKTGRLPGIFFGEQIFYWNLLGENLGELNCAMAVAGYMASGEIDDPDGFSRYTSMLSDEGWKIAINYCSYHQVHLALDSLEDIHSAMMESLLNINAAKAGMESAMTMQWKEPRVYERENMKATLNLINFAALYASYIDVCRRIRKYLSLDSSSQLSRAIRRIIRENWIEHRFIYGLRQFILHYDLVRPQVTISISETRSVELHLDASFLLRAGFEWPVEQGNISSPVERLILSSFCQE